jgi:hypothetical protein
MSKKQTLKDKLANKQKDLKAQSSGGKYFTFKEGITRMRPVWCGKEEDWGIEVIYFFLGKDLGGIISPATFDMPCAIFKRAEKMANSKKESDREFAKKFLRKGRKFAVPHIRYNDPKGKELDERAGVKLALLAPGQYDALLDLYLDDENGDFTDPIEGYDIKYKRVGKGMMDTQYSVIRCQPTKAPKDFRGPYNVEEMVKANMPSYDETKEILDKFMNSSHEDEDDEPVKKKKKKSKDL